VRDWILVALTAVFVGLYAAALLGWIHSDAADSPAVLRLEPIIAVIIGYYFGRVPGEKNEKTLKQQVDREAQKAGEAEEKKEEAQRGEAAAHVDKAALEQKVRSTRAALTAAVPQGGPDGLPSNLGDARAAPADDALPVNDAAARHAVAAALQVLDS